MWYSSFQFNLALNSVLLFWKLLVFEFLLGVSQNFVCSVSVFLAKTVILLDALQLLVLFVGTLIYFEPKLSPFMTPCSGTSLICNNNCNSYEHIYIFFFFNAAYVRVATLFELLLFEWQRLSYLFLFVLFVSLLVLTLELATGLLSKHVNK
jgi:hypothetical protein